MTRFIIRAGLVLALFVVAFVGLSLVGLLEPAFAQAVATVTTPGAATATNVLVPAGDWITWSLNNVRDVLTTTLVGVSTWAVARFTPSLVGVFQAARVEQLIGRAVDFAIASIEGATHGQVVTIPVANAVLQKALEMAVQSAPKLAKSIEDTIRPKIIARMAAAGIVPATASVGMVLSTDGSLASIVAPVVGFVPSQAL
ncbi:MAG: hypothetical protein JWM36_3265 [Hyphomicrobiales bacterium]|nr:hypothetical protein [Hyphomicrobiales bacterium]